MLKANVGVEIIKLMDFEKKFNENIFSFLFDFNFNRFS